MKSRKPSGLMFTVWAMLAIGPVLVFLGFYAIGPEWQLQLGLFVFFGGLFLWPHAHHLTTQHARHEAALRYEEVLKTHRGIDGNEELLLAPLLNLKHEADKSVWSSENNPTVGFVMGAYEAGKLWVTACGSEERVVLTMRCDKPGTLFNYGYRRNLKWIVCDWGSMAPVGTIVMRPTFLGRIRWSLSTNDNVELGCVAASLEWGRLFGGFGASWTDVVADNIRDSGHHGEVLIGSRKLCKVSWSGRCASIDFGNDAGSTAERMLSIAAAVLLAECPDYYRRA